MNQEQVITEIFSQLSLSEKTKLLHQWVCNDPENLQTALSVFTRASKTEDEIQDTITNPKQHAMTMSELESDDEADEGPIFPPGTVTLRRFTDLDLQRLNELDSRQRRQTIAALNLNDSEHDSLVNKLWRLRNPDRVRLNSRRAYQKRAHQKIQNTINTNTQQNITFDLTRI
jgi:hypothetical protein